PRSATSRKEKRQATTTSWIRRSPRKRLRSSANGKGRFAQQRRSEAAADRAGRCPPLWAAPVARHQPMKARRKDDDDRCPSDSQQHRGCRPTSSNGGEGTLVGKSGSLPIRVRRRHSDRLGNRWATHQPDFLHLSKQDRARIL